METVTATYEMSGETDKYEVRCIKCPHCDSAEELPIDEQRWHFQHFIFIDNKDTVGCEEWIYECVECKTRFKVEWEPKTPEQKADDIMNDICNGDHLEVIREALENHFKIKPSIFKIPDVEQRCGGCNWNDCNMYVIAENQEQADKLFKDGQAGMCNACIVDLIVSEWRLVV